MNGDLFNRNYFVGILVFCTLVACHNGKENQTDGKGAKIMKISSTAFEDKGNIPPVYTCDAEDYSPPLQWSGIPGNTKSLALIVDDPDAPAGTWVHWVLYNIPMETRELVENFSRESKLPDGTLQGRNDFGKIGYGGPCPPGGRHRYYFKLYALDTFVSPTPGLTKNALLDAMEGHILGRAELMGTYRRK